MSAKSNPGDTASLTKPNPADPFISREAFQMPPGTCSCKYSPAMTLLPITTVGGPRYSMSSIYYLLTTDSSIGQFHLNRSDIMHYYHLGDAIQYSLISPDGTLKTVSTQGC